MTEEQIEVVAVSLWKQEAVRAAPNVARGRTLEAFREETQEADQQRWLDSARAAIAAYEATLVPRWWMYKHPARKNAQYFIERASNDWLAAGYAETPLYSIPGDQS